MSPIDESKSWADTGDVDPNELPAATEVYENGVKITTEYKYNSDGKKVKVVRNFKITKEVVPKIVAHRKTWAKFGDSHTDKPGPNSHTTMVSEDVFMQFITNKEEEKASDSLLDPLKNIAKCRICNGEHWSVNCPFKGTSMENKPQASVVPETTSKSGKYVPPFMKDSQKGGMSSLRGRDDTTAIRISNLSESMVEADLEELVKKIGPHSKMYLARDKNTGLCKGFAYVHFRTRKDAAAAIDVLNGHGYDHLILNVEWSKPQNN